jgi:hypothetical protein
VTQADIKIAVYQDTIDLVEAVARTYGPTPQVACRSIVQQLRGRIDEVIDGECHRMAVEAMGPELLS